MSSSIERSSNIVPPRNTDRNDPFWKSLPELAQSNARASDSIMIMAALIRPRFDQLQTITDEFGFDRVLAEWEVLQQEGLKPAHLATVIGVLHQISPSKSHPSARTQGNAGLIR